MRLIRRVVEAICYTIIAAFLVTVGLVVPLLAMRSMSDEDLLLFLLLSP